jgi:quinol monooxygenase YgiN
MSHPDRRSLLKAAALGSLASLVATSAAAQDQATLFVIAEIVAKPDAADQLRDLLVPFAASSAKEPGCLEYTLMEVDKEPGRFLTFERWTGRDALDAHMKTPEIAALVPKLGEILAKPFTQIFLGAPAKA